MSGELSWSYYNDDVYIPPSSANQRGMFLPIAIGEIARTVYIHDQKGDVGHFADKISKRKEGRQRDS
jgi:hypothetical protein